MAKGHCIGHVNQVDSASVRMSGENDVSAPETTILSRLFLRAWDLGHLLVIS